MEVKIIQVVPEKPYIRGRDSKRMGIQHRRERPYLLVAGQELPPDVLEKLHADYPGTDREPVKAEMLAEFNRKPTLLMATMQTVEIEIRALGGGMGNERPTMPNDDPFVGYSYPEIQDLAAKAGIPAVGVSRKKLVAALTEAGVVPAETQG